MAAKALPKLTVQHRRIDARKIKLLEQNAHFMRHETFMRLVSNIREDGTATSTPLIWLRHDDTRKKPLYEPEDDQAYLCLSGNHRVQATIAAEVYEIDVLCVDEYLTPERRIAIQLSHNAIFGEDDPATLKALYSDIGSYEMKLYTGLDDKQLELLDNVSVAALTTAALDYQTITMTFLPHETEHVQAIWESACKAAAGSKAVWLARWADYDRFMDSLDAAGRAYDIKNTATALLLILEVFSRHLDDLTPGYLDALGEPISPKRKVPVGSAFPDPYMPARTAAKLKAFFEAHEDGWQALEERLTLT